MGYLTQTWSICWKTPTGTLSCRYCRQWDAQLQEADKRAEKIERHWQSASLPSGVPADVNYEGWKQEIIIFIQKFFNATHTGSGHDYMKA
jgi:hypothetical protein